LFFFYFFCNRLVYTKKNAGPLFTLHACDQLEHNERICTGESELEQLQ
jgi:hypothetical protein